MRKSRVVLAFLCSFVFVCQASSQNSSQKPREALDTLSSSSEVYSFLFRSELTHLLKSNHHATVGKLFFLAIAGDRKSGIVGPGRKIADGLSDIPIEIADASEFQWSDSVMWWLHRSTGRRGVDCFVHIRRWISARQAEADVGVVFATEAGHSSKVLLKKGRKGWRIVRVISSEVY